MMVTGVRAAARERRVVDGRARDQVVIHIHTKARVSRGRRDLDYGGVRGRGAGLQRREELKADLLRLRAASSDASARAVRLPMRVLRPTVLPCPRRGCLQRTRE